MEQGYRSYMSTRAPPIEHRSVNWPYSKKSPHIPLRLLQATIKSSKYDGPYKRDAVIRSCRAFLGQRTGPFATLYDKIKDTPDFIDVTERLMLFTRSFQLEGYERALEDKLQSRTIQGNNGLIIIKD